MLFLCLYTRTIRKHITKQGVDMPIVIGVGNEKGGCGKTTTSYQLAVDLKTRGKAVVLIDNDPQKGAYRWKAGASDPSVTPSIATMENPLTMDDIKLFSGADYIIIDGPPGFGNDPRLRACHDYLNALSIHTVIPLSIRNEIRDKIRAVFGFDGTIAAKISAIMKLSDLMIIPTLASVQDLEPTINLIRDMIAPYSERFGRPKYRVLVTDSDERTKLFKEARDYLCFAKIPIFETSIKHREIYRQAAASGYTVIENHTDIKATEETRLLTDEVLKIFEGIIR